MNIITNNCVGARCYQILKQQFQNPFMWSIVLPSDFRYLIENFNKIRFNNVTTFKEYLVPREAVTYGLLLDNKIKVFFIHHKFDETATTPTKKGSDLYYNKIEEYLVHEWMKRLSRMNNEPPHFLGVANGYWSNADIYKFIQLNTEYKKSLIVYDNRFTQYSTAASKIVAMPKSGISTYRVAQIFIDQCKQDNYTL